MEWDSSRRTMVQIERRLNEIGSLVHGNQKYHAERVVDLVEQIDELRQAIKAMKERQDNIAAWLKKNVAIKADSEE